jgi:hypothetical protein
MLEQVNIADDRNVQWMPTLTVTAHLPYSRTVVLVIRRSQQMHLIAEVAAPAPNIHLTHHPHPTTVVRSNPTSCSSALRPCDAAATSPWTWQTGIAMGYPSLLSIPDALDKIVPQLAEALAA